MAPNGYFIHRDYTTRRISFTELYKELLRSLLIFSLSSQNPKNNLPNFYIHIATKSLNYALPPPTIPKSTPILLLRVLNLLSSPLNRKWIDFQLYLSFLSYSPLLLLSRCYKTYKHRFNWVNIRFKLPSRHLSIVRHPGSIGPTPTSLRSKVLHLTSQQQKHELEEKNGGQGRVRKRRRR